MEVEILRSFDKDVSKTDPAIRKKVLRTIVELEAATSLDEIRQVKRLSGYRDAYRIRIGDHRLGLFLKGRTLQLARLLHRKEAYRHFP
jgi:mRNA interferase RelE/StbE